MDVFGSFVRLWTKKDRIIFNNNSYNINFKRHNSATFMSLYFDVSFNYIKHFEIIDIIFKCLLTLCGSENFIERIK